MHLSFYSVVLLVFLSVYLLTRHSEDGVLQSTHVLLRLGRVRYNGQSQLLRKLFQFSLVYVPEIQRIVLAQVDLVAADQSRYIFAQHFLGHLDPW